MVRRELAEGAGMAVSVVGAASAADAGWDDSMPSRAAASTPVLRESQQAVPLLVGTELTEATNW